MSAAQTNSKATSGTSSGASAWFRRADKAESRSATSPSTSQSWLDSRAASEASVQPSVFMDDIEIVGDVGSAGRIEIKGNVRGDIQCLSAKIFAGAHVEGTITAEGVDIHGSVTGTVRAKKVRLRSTSRFEGDIYQRSLCVDEGAHFVGTSCPLEDARSVVWTSSGPVAEVAA